MKWTTVFLILAIGSSRAQLNFEGSPLTENTEYTAEESKLSQRTARQEETPSRQSIPSTVAPKRVYPVTEQSITTTSKKLDPEKPKNVDVARQFPKNQVQETKSVSQAELALSHFLNSKTPEESRMSLDHYLQSREPSVEGRAETIPSDQQQRQSFQAGQSVQVQSQMMSPLDQRLHPQFQQQQVSQNYRSVNQMQQIPQVHGQYTNPQNFQQIGGQNTALINPGNPVVGPLGAESQLQVPQTPYYPGIQARNDFFYPAGWNNRIRRIRGKPYPFAQNRIGPGFLKGHGPVPFKHKAPVEVIYTKPPGFHRLPPAINNPPVPYEDAGGWFPDADYPPPSKDVYYSQLYAQSYDPHYYNYIAKTGKIKPHLYGKLGKYHDEEGGGIWAELYRGFKKHGLKNLMTPTFLLGMTLPVVTLMLSALVQKRSLGRSDSRDLSREEVIQEYLEKLQRAVECYERRRRKNEDGSLDDC